MIKSMGPYAETVIVLAPSFNDSSVAVDVLKSAGISAYACRDIIELGEMLTDDFGAVIIADESIEQSGAELLLKYLDRQQPWSDIPIIVLTSSDLVENAEFFSKSGNISLLERPFSKLTLIRSVQTALRARKKQYEVKGLLADLSKSKEDAERANLLKTQFLANMSHEIRTPIGAILGFTDLLKNPSNSNDEKNKYMSIVERNSQQLLRLIDDILDLSKVEAGKMTFENTDFSLAELLNDFISGMSFKASEKGIALETKFESLIPDIICLDSVRLRQILTNIVGNAIKFTDKGSVRLKISCAGSCLKFVVEDTGVGIPKNLQQGLFQPFTQADTSTTRKYGGTGLGLVLSRKLAVSLGGKLELIKSEQNKGSTFLIEVNAPPGKNSKMIGFDALAVATPFASSGPSGNILNGLKVLLIEDSPENQILITTYLRKEGAQIKAASNGAQGVHIALNENFDLVLMDIQMPVLDGYEATKKLRQSHYPKPIIALTAHAMKEERDRCLKSGFTEYLTKPVQKNLLYEVLSKYVH